MDHQTLEVPRGTHCWLEREQLHSKRRAALIGGGSWRVLVAARSSVFLLVRLLPVGILRCRGLLLPLDGQISLFWGWLWAALINKMF